MCSPLYVVKIAAKIGGESGTSVNSNDYGYGGQKRPLEDGDQPEPKKVAPPNNDCYSCKLLNLCASNGYMKLCCLALH
ncbi:UNVERIFIED_CONTAM: Far upstream element-binding protein 1 [Gekko kuhli]